VDATTLGGLIGIAGTLSGALVTSLATHARERRAKERETKALVAAARLELAEQREALDVGREPATLSCAAFEVLLARGALGALPTEQALKLAAAYESFRQVNDRIAVMRLAAAALIAGSGIEKFGGIGDLRKDVDRVRERSLGCVNEALATSGGRGA